MNDPTQPVLSDESVLALTDAVSSLTERLEDAKKAERRNRLWNLVTTIVLIAVIVVGAYAWNLTRRVDHTTGIVKDVQCSLYGMFLGAYDPDGEQARANPERYEASFAQIRADFARLECKMPVPPVPTTTTTSAVHENTRVECVQDESPARPEFDCTEW